MPEKEDKRVKIKVEEESASSEALSEEKPEEAPKEEKVENKSSSFFVLFISFLLGLVFGAGLIGGIFYYKTKVEKPNNQAVSQPTPGGEQTTEMTPEASPSASPSDHSLSTYKVQILNGSGKAGEAAKAEKLLKTAGLTNTKTANALSYDYKETEISLKSNVPDAVYETVVKSLSSYQTKKAGTLDDSSLYDIIITIGQEIK
jgi:hypothetical protein